MGSSESSKNMTPLLMEGLGVGQAWLKHEIDDKKTTHARGNRGLMRNFF